MAVHISSFCQARYQNDKVDDGDRLATQVVPTRLINKAVRNKLLRACCHRLVNNL